MLPFRVRANLIPHHCKHLQFQVEAFHRLWYQTQCPVKYASTTFAQLNTIPAIDTWIKRPAERRKPGIIGDFELNYGRFNDHRDMIVPVERTVWVPNTNKKWNVSSFERFEAPLSFFLDWTQQKLADPEGFCPNESLYIAQCPINPLPLDLRKDLPAPIYSTTTPQQLKKEKSDNGVLEAEPPSTEDSSIWMGIPPTETPLHKDPNSNFFVQIAGYKTIRLVSPEDGEFMLGFSKRTIAEHRLAQGLNARIDMGMRGQEMMVGPERGLMRELIWGVPVCETGRPLESVEDGTEKKEVTKDSGKKGYTTDRPIEVETEGSPIVVSQAIGEAPDIDIWEVPLTPGDALFIPQGWYHSVRSVGDYANGINVSANWWFRHPMPK